MAKHLTDKEFEDRFAVLQSLDARNNGQTNYTKSFLDEQDAEAAEYYNRKKKPKKPTHKKSFEEKQIEEFEPFNPKHNNEKEPFTFSIVGFVKRIVTLPFRLIYEFFEWYLSNMTLMRKITLAFFAFTTIFCGWIAFLKVVDLYYDLLSTFTNDCSVSPFDTAETFPWILLAVVWILPFIIHFFGKYFIVWIPVVVLGLALFEVVTGDAFLTNAFFDFLDMLASKL